MLSLDFLIQCQIRGCLHPPIFGGVLKKNFSATRTYPPDPPTFILHPPTFQFLEISLGELCLNAISHFNPRRRTSMSSRKFCSWYGTSCHMTRSTKPTLCLKKGVPLLFFFNNFGKCRPISIILSLLYSQIYCWGRWHWKDHLTLSLLPHYLAKLECAIQVKKVVKLNMVQ